MGICGNQASFQLVCRKQRYLPWAQLRFMTLVNKHYKQFHNTFPETMWFFCFFQPLVAAASISTVCSHTVRLDTRKYSCSGDRRSASSCIGILVAQGTECNHNLETWTSPSFGGTQGTVICSVAFNLSSGCNLFPFTHPWQHLL